MVHGDVSCSKARRVLDKFSDSIADGECDQPPECTDASPGRWKCANVRPDKPGEYPGRVLRCKRSGDKIALVYTGPPITGE